MGSMGSGWPRDTSPAPGDRPIRMGAGIPSIASVPLVLASAIAARTTRLRIGTGVSVLPLCHPIRTAEEAATVDQISQGRLDFGIGRSGFPRAYAGYGIPYKESRERFPGIPRGHSQSLEQRALLTHRDRISPVMIWP